MTIYISSISPKVINQIDISNLPAGYYIAKIDNENSSIQVKLVKK
ncbi:T9SS type A sorting domain-containing protein [Flavobacterium silvisoli]|uniref:T9SS type A sorting domain-containing protein n=1 Tax=Flavobacterium silvisoli TaxID=2529433 RepID=A0A4Q9Z585_9FLAO|nr:T9SS type A sorting domain-containing protein [Flavobacterium silvisoli]